MTVNRYKQTRWKRRETTLNEWYQVTCHQRNTYNIYPSNIYELNFSQLFKTWEVSTTEKPNGKTNTFCIIIKYYRPTLLIEKNQTSFFL